MMGNKDKQKSRLFPTVMFKLPLRAIIHCESPSCLSALISTPLYLPKTSIRDLAFDRTPNDFKEMGKGH